MMKLFMIGLGGSIQGANIEVHDMQFVIAETIEDCYKVVKERWYGNNLHIDSYTELKYIDGYKVDLSGKSELELYMIVYGGYTKEVIDELHKYHFILSSSVKEAKRLAKIAMKQFPTMDHVDSVINVFENAVSRFGLIQGEFAFKDNETVHTFVKLA